jgi:hypothetical protein
MTSQTSQSQHHIADLLPAYVNGRLDRQHTEQVQRHLLHCEACHTELADWQALHEAAQLTLAATPRPLTNVLERAWGKIDTLPQQSQSSWSLMGGAIIHLWLVFKRQVRLIHKSIWVVPPLLLLFGYSLAHFAVRGSIDHLHQVETVLALITTVSAAAGVAFIYGAENDAAIELTLSTPTSIRIVMLCRLVLVVGYNFIIAACTSTCVALLSDGSPWDIMQLWLGPMLLFSSMALALSLLLGSWFAMIVTFMLEVTQAILSGFTRYTPALRFTPPELWQTTPMMLLLALLIIVFAVIYAPRQPRLSN